MPVGRVAYINKNLSKFALCSLLFARITCPRVWGGRNSRQFIGVGIPGWGVLVISRHKIIMHIQIVLYAPVQSMNNFIYSCAGQICIGNTDQFIALGFYVFCSGVIVCDVLRVLVTIKFDCKSQRMTDKINNIRADWLLTAKFYTQLIAINSIPEFAFCV